MCGGSRKKFPGRKLFGGVGIGCVGVWVFVALCGARFGSDGFWFTFRRVRFIRKAATALNLLFGKCPWGSELFGEGEGFYV